MQIVKTKKPQPKLAAAILIRLANYRKPLVAKTRLNLALNKQKTPQKRRFQS